MFDKDFQRELNVKFDILKSKLNEISQGKEDFYRNIQKSKIDSLYKYVDSAKQIEDLVFKTLTKVDSLKNSHEEAAAVFVKLNELNENNRKILTMLEEDTELLIDLKENMAINNQAIKKNITSIKERLDKLKNKK